MLKFEATDMNIRFGEKIKEEPPRIPTFNQHLNYFYTYKLVCIYVSFEEFIEIILAFILSKGTNYAVLNFKNEYFHIYDKKEEILFSRSFREFSFVFNRDIKKSLIPHADQMLGISKRIYGNCDMSKYLDFYHVRYCTNLMPLERQYLERKGIFGIGKAIKHLFGKNSKKIVK